ncbi:MULTISPECIES: hypothetical protein [Paraburkholderia]|uniref:hypothetical protein n=1 Tax=Paraburkholderia TaxID=1822464 RepID=UPI00225974AF|nr:MULTISPECIES: hypothetical protein [Paraburkholderia]MCX4176794.1 hypothetical protein [Paraburkholderia madseniana]MDQ6464785.1 hypothetical protein [Paraburkholderia madseniana]
MAVYFAGRANTTVGTMQKSDLFGDPAEPDRSVPLDEVWRQAQEVLEKLEQAEAQG